ncbi:Ribulose bisphosphate carboxylase small subunit, chloroplastic [Linum grandiflorum]
MSGISLTVAGCYHGLKSNSSSSLPFSNSSKAASDVAWRRRTLSNKNGRIKCCMQTWNPIKNKKFETLSYLPPLSQESIAREIDYMLTKGWIPCLEFDQVGYVYRENSRMPGYYDGRYWTLWKLPMFGCNDSSQVLKEIQLCKQTYPNAYIRCLAFDNQQQGQCMSFIIQTPDATTTTTA